ncbi:glycoside hydrolase family 26 protein [Thermotalea metallivorans]|uniref:Endoglucanase H n=1 Tax=Thermotalea metallivorans TaxID=520762 RepID=A0A140L315_9FIRM|nr:glycosyl hydrolase [Thermotalea metallivorans]KXG74940.1 Endoglucanase H [Thermotalea metallivorans]
MKLKRIGAVLCASMIFLSSMVVYGETIDSISTFIKNGKIVAYSDFSEEDDFKKIIPIDHQYNEYINYAHGYSLQYPNHMYVDVSLSAVKTLIYDQDRNIEIYYDNFQGTPTSAADYIGYSNRFLKNSRDHVKEYEDTLYIHGMKTHLLKWSREKLPKVHHDKNYYVSAEIVKNYHEVYTIIIKSARPFENYEDYMNIISSFRIVERKGTPKIYMEHLPVHKNFDEETKAFYEKYFVNSKDLKWGIFEYSAPKDFGFLHSLEEKLDYTFEFLVLYQSFSSNGFPMEEMKNAYEHHRYVELTLQTMYMDGRDNSGVTYDILKGKYDSFFHEYAKQAKQFGHPILFRLNNEMNGDWCVYSSYHSSKDPEMFKAVWKHVYNIFQRAGADNVLWVWNPHDGSFPNFAWNHYLNYYPGDAYVDIVGLTGYNAGTYYPGEKWRGFQEIYIPLYEEYDRLFKQPLMITEFGSNSVGGDKIQWIHEMFDTMKTFERIKVAIWWNGIDWDKHMNPARIYRLDQSPEMINTFRERLKEYR